jgi:predicted solute-binding protein
MKAFRNAYDFSRKNLSEIITRASTWKKFSHPFIDKYLRELDFSFKNDAREGLRTFFDLAFEAGLVENKRKLEFVK